MSSELSFEGFPSLLFVEDVFLPLELFSSLLFMVDLVLPGCLASALPVLLLDMVSSFGTKIESDDEIDGELKMRCFER